MSGVLNTQWYILSQWVDFCLPCLVLSPPSPLCLLPARMARSLRERWWMTNLYSEITVVYVFYSWAMGENRGSPLFYSTPMLNVNLIQIHLYYISLYDLHSFTNVGNSNKRLYTIFLFILSPMTTHIFCGHSGRHTKPRLHNLWLGQTISHRRHPNLQYFLFSI